MSWPSKGCGSNVPLGTSWGFSCHCRYHGRQHQTALADISSHTHMWVLTENIACLHTRWTLDNPEQVIADQLRNSLRDEASNQRWPWKINTTGKYQKSHGCCGVSDAPTPFAELQPRCLATSMQTDVRVLSSPPCIYSQDDGPAIAANKTV